MSQFTGQPLTGKISEKPEQWLTIVATKKKEEEKTMGELISLEGKRLGTGPKVPSGDDWLSKLKIGTVFICEINQDAGLATIVQSEYLVERKDTGSIMLVHNMSDPEASIRVNPERFCKYNSLVTIVYEPEQEQTNAD